MEDRQYGYITKLGLKKTARRLSSILVLPKTKIGQNLNFLEAKKKNNNSDLLLLPWRQN